MLPFATIPRNCIIGIDPGVTGALGFIDTVDWTLGVIAMPTIDIVVGGKNRREPSPAALAAIVREVQPIAIAAEKMSNFGGHPNPDDLMKLGRWRGQIEGIAAMAETGFVHDQPSVWKARMGLTADKTFSRTRASALFPACKHFWRLKGQHDEAEAALITLYGCLSLGFSPTRPVRPMDPALAPMKRAA